MDSLEMETNPQEMWENLRKMAEDMRVELPEQDPNRKDRPDALKNWHITVPRQNEPS